MAALLMRMSAPPSSSATRSTVSCTEERSETSVSRAMLRAPARARLPATRSALSCSTSATATAAPAVARAEQIPSPRPPPPPVTSATRPSRSGALIALPVRQWSGSSPWGPAVPSSFSFSFSWLPADPGRRAFSKNLFGTSGRDQFFYVRAQRAGELVLHRGERAQLGVRGLQELAQGQPAVCREGLRRGAPGALDEGCAFFEKADGVIALHNLVVGREKEPRPQAF